MQHKKYIQEKVTIVKNKQTIYQRDKQTVYKSEQSQQALMKKKGVHGAATLLGTASIFLSNVPLSVYADEISGTEVPTTTVTDATTETEKAEAPVETPVTPTAPVTPETSEPVVPTEPEQPAEIDTGDLKTVTPKKPVITQEEKDTPEVPKETPEEKTKDTETPSTPEKPLTPVETEPKETPAETKDQVTDTTTTEQATNVSQPTETPETPVAAPIVQGPVSSPITNSEVPDSSVATDGSIHFEANESVESFVRKIGESARKIGQQEDLYASVMIAQAILESGAGSSELSSSPNYNLFGIKGSYNGQSVTYNTQEDQGNGNMTTIKDSFRKYKNYEESFEDYAKLLKKGISGNENYYSGAWKTNASTYEEATKFLTGRYATDTKYNQKLNGLIETYELEKYDKEAEKVETSATGFAIPVKNYTISSHFGQRGSEFHRGLDMAASQGEPIYASKAGTVLRAEFHYSWGNHVVIEHGDGMTTLYAHQAEYVVQPGDTVEQGQLIGYVGSTGNSTGSHLHFEVCKNSSLSADQLMNPADILFG